MRVFVDTNVFVYLFDRDEPEKRGIAQEFLRRQNDGLELVVSTQVLQEFYVAVTRKLAVPLPEKVAARAVRSMARFPVISTTSDMVLAAIARSIDESFSLWDAMIVEAALRSGAEQLISEDMQDGRQIETLQIHNPFTGSGPAAV